MSRPPVLGPFAVATAVVVLASGWACPKLAEARGAAPVGVAPATPPSVSTWFILTRDGILHALRDGVDQPVARALGESRDLVALDGRRWAVLGKDAITLLTLPVTPGPTAFRALPGKAADLSQLVGGGAHLYAATRGGEVVELTIATGARTTLGHFARTPLLVYDGAKLLVAHDGVIEELGTSHKWQVEGRPIAMAATATRIYCATKEGPLWLIEREPGSQRDLGLGGWWGTLALDADANGHGVYVATQSGKLWHIDPVTLTKVAAAMDGWAGTVGLLVRTR